MRTALVRDGVVHDIVMAGPGLIVPAGSQAVPSDTANIGEVYDGTAFSPAEFNLSRDELVLEARFRRQEIASKGVRVNVAKAGLPAKMVLFPTEDKDRADLDAIAYLAERDPAFVGHWWHVSHGTLVLDAAKILEIKVAIARHVASSHFALNYTIEAIKAGQITTPDQVALNIECPACECLAAANTSKSTRAAKIPKAA